MAGWAIGLSGGTDFATAIQMGSGMFRCRLSSGVWLEDCVVSSAFVSSWLTVIQFGRSERGHVLPVLVLLPDSLGLEDFRRLRLFLRWAVPQMEQEQ